MTLACAPAGALAAQADEGWSFSGSMRLRHETVDNQVRPGFNQSEDLVSLRTTLGAEYNSGPLTLAAEMYDSRVFKGDRRSPISTNEVNTFEVVQAYASLQGEAGVLGKSRLTAGRMMLNLGSRRLVAADDYRNTTNSYTGLRLDAQPAGVRTTFIYVLPQVRLPDGIDNLLDARHHVDREGSQQVLWGVLAAKPKTVGPATLEGYYFRLDETDTRYAATRDRKLDTYGGRLFVEPKKSRFDFEVEAIGQTGTISADLTPTARELEAKAHFVHADAGYTFAHAWKPRLSAEFDLATGDERGGKFDRFDTLFGMRRADFGPSGIYAAIHRSNIVTPGLRLEFEPSDRMDAFISARSMWLEVQEDSFSTTAVRDASGRSGRFAGNQVEGRVRYWFIEDRLRGEVDALWLDKGRFLREAPNAPRSGDETYLSLNLLASF
ncbi:hypothetical protein DJ018_15950 [Phenylobacterium deserti]|uniref:Alginate export domain-containing protein n=2 Tax=Phenylobacterium deserti TaxID=1914756 RepID=A0A328A9X0_9CAUL|nr:hypothetical protein DJ018_15950 [Phenylobacterium deserti]